MRFVILSFFFLSYVQATQIQCDLALSNAHQQMKLWWPDYDNPQNFTVTNNNEQWNVKVIDKNSKKKVFRTSKPGNNDIEIIITNEGHAEYMIRQWPPRELNWRHTQSINATIATLRIAFEKLGARLIKVEIEKNQKGLKHFYRKSGFQLMSKDEEGNETWAISPSLYNNAFPSTSSRTSP